MRPVLVQGVVWQMFHWIVFCSPHVTMYVQAVHTTMHSLDTSNNNICNNYNVHNHCTNAFEKYLWTGSKPFHEIHKKHQGQIVKSLRFETLTTFRANALSPLSLVYLIQGAMQCFCWFFYLFKELHWFCFLFCCWQNKYSYMHTK